MVEEAQPAPVGTEKKGPGRPSRKQTGLDSSGLKFQGIGSWQTIRFHKKARRRDHRKMSLLVETRQRHEKVVYEWRLDRSKVGDVTAGMKMLPDLPPDTGDVAVDPAYDARKFYAGVEERGATPICKPRKNARTQTRDARGRAIRWMLTHPTQWKGRYHRRPITEAVNFALKRKFGDRLWSRGLRSQRIEFGFRILVYNSGLVCRSRLRGRVPRRDL